MFNICSREPIHRSLIGKGRGYNLGGAGFPHTTHRPSQPVVSALHLRASPGLQFNQALQKVPKFNFKEPMATTWSSDHLAIYHNQQLHLATTNDLFLSIGSTRIVRKEILMQLGYQSNSYNLMHNQES
jgi:hypothetical protein